MKVSKLIGVGQQYANICLGEEILINLDALKYLKNQGRTTFRCLNADNTMVTLKMYNDEIVTVPLTIQNIVISNLKNVYKSNCDLTFEKSTFFDVNCFITSLSETHRNHFVKNNVAKYLPMPLLANQQANWNGPITQWQKK